MSFITSWLIIAELYNTFIAYGGFTFVKVQVNGVMSDNNIYAACTAAGLRVPCAGPAGCSYNNGLCTLTSETGCGLPMYILSQQICGANVYPSSCPAFYGLYQYMGNNWISGN